MTVSKLHPGVMGHARASVMAKFELCSALSCYLVRQLPYRLVVDPLLGLFSIENQGPMWAPTAGECLCNVK